LDDHKLPKAHGSEMSESFVIILPLPPRELSPNCAVATAGGRFAKASATKRYRRLAKQAVEAVQIDSTPWGKMSVQALFCWPTKRRRDQDNAIASLKSAYDGIVDSGLICDDDYNHMQRLSPEFSIDRKYPRVELTITRRDTR